MRYHKDGKLTPFASGFRMHNGITRSPDGEIWCGDNQETGVAGLRSVV